MNGEIIRILQADVNAKHKYIQELEELNRQETKERLAYVAWLEEELDSQIIHNQFQEDQLIAAKGMIGEAIEQRNEAQNIVRVQHETLESIIKGESAAETTAPPEWTKTRGITRTYREVYG